MPFQNYQKSDILKMKKTKEIGGKIINFSENMNDEMFSTSLAGGFKTYLNNLTIRVTPLTFRIVPLPFQVTPVPS